MKILAVAFAVCALCAIAFADDVPDVLFPCSFRLTARAVLLTEDGEEMASTINEMLHDGDDYWVWKSQLTGNEFFQAIVPDHEWAITWRKDLMGESFRHDIPTQKCYVSKDLPTPLKWIESKTYGILWFDEPVMYEDKEATLYTASAMGTYGKVDYEITAGFYVLNDDHSLVLINGTVTAEKQSLKLNFKTTSLSFEHNKAIDPKFFVVSAPCELHDAPAGPSESFKEKCYKPSGAAMVGVSYLALLIALLAALLNF